MSETHTQMQFLATIDRVAENETISQRVSDGYVNATAMCKAAGKPWSEYARASGTRPFITELSSALGIPQDGLIQSIVGGVPHLQGTWVHPQVAVHLAQWLSPKFAVMVSGWVYEWLSGGHRAPALPYHLRRYLANVNNVPYGFFSMLNEVTLALFGPMEKLGYAVPSNRLPDISLGKTFSNHLRRLGHPVDTYPKYPHEFEDGRVVEARAYPNDLIGELRRFFVEEWMRTRGRAYFADRDPAALPYFERLLASPNLREALGYVEMERSLL